MRIPVGNVSPLTAGASAQKPKAPEKEREKKSTPSKFSFGKTGSGT